MKKLIPLLLTPLFCTAVLAQEPEEPTIPKERQPTQLNFEQLDRNQDGTIDMDEAKADKELAAVFATLAKQGKLEEKEYVNWRAEHAKKKH